MLKPAEFLIGDTDAVVISDVSVPDLSALGWFPADQIYLSIEGQQSVGGFYTPDVSAQESRSVIELTSVEIPIDNLLADVENVDLGAFDLNELLAPADSISLTELFPLGAELVPLNMAFPQFTIMIEDESDPNTVAI